MRVLVACEFSGIVRDAFFALGHDAVSCDLLPTERPKWTLEGFPEIRVRHPKRGYHFKQDVRGLLDDDWDLMIAHPPCQFLCNSGAKHLYIGGVKQFGRDERRWRNMELAVEFFKTLLNAPIPKIAVENPIMHGHAKRLIGVNQTQIIQPYEHGHPETKATCLWLKGLPRLVPSKWTTGPITERVARISPSEDRWKERSRTLEGIAAAMALQWGVE